MFENPDHRMKVTLLIGVAIVTTWAAAIWQGDGRLGATGALMLFPFVASLAWTIWAYDAETLGEAQIRKEAKRKKVQTDA